MNAVAFVGIFLVLWYKETIQNFMQKQKTTMRTKKLWL